MQKWASKLWVLLAVLTFILAPKDAFSAEPQCPNEVTAYGQESVTITESGFIAEHAYTPVMSEMCSEAEEEAAIAAEQECVNKTMELCPAGCNYQINYPVTSCSTSENNRPINPSCTGSCYSTCHAYCWTPPY